MTLYYYAVELCIVLWLYNDSSLYLSLYLFIVYMIHDQLLSLGAPQRSEIVLPHFTLLPSAHARNAMSGGRQQGVCVFVISLNNLYDTLYM